MLAIKKLLVVLVIATTVFGGGGFLQTEKVMASGVPPAAVAAGSSSAAGGWIVGGIFISVASVIACAMIVGSAEGREMTAEEALLSGLIPLGCLLREELGLDQP